ncbi:hypothetical protein AALC17_17280 [Oscillospiraceae bacterium 38-13]
MKKIRKLTSLLLVLVMSLALAVPCFAAGPAAADDDEIIYLDVGDTYTDPETGYTYSFRPLGSVSARSGRGFPSYIVKNERLSGSSFHNNYTADPDLGNTFVVSVYNEGSKNIRMTLNLNFRGGEKYVAANQPGELVVKTDDPNYGVSGTAAVAVYAYQNPQLSGKISIYEIWE